MTQLRLANGLAGRYFGTRPHCIEAVALLVRTAEVLGAVLTPRAVALAAKRSDGSVAALGEQAVAAWRGLKVSDALRPEGWDGAGHVVATLDSPPHLFDPTLGRVSTQLGIMLSPIACSVTSVDPPTGTWRFGDETLALRYYLVPEDTSWLDPFDDALHHCARLARDLAAVVRSETTGSSAWSRRSW